LRLFYLGLLTVFTALAWAATVQTGGSASAVFQVSRMAEAGKNITATIVWFQFIATQLIAAVMLSTSIGDEIYNRTLGVLMTTPINSFQIVIGKLFSRLLQLLLLLAISCPLLAVLRVFGGVPWDYVISSLCVTLASAVFVGSTSLFFSIYSRRAHEVILRTVIACAVLWLLPSAVLELSYAGFGGLAKAELIFDHASPFAVMLYNTERMLHPSSAAVNRFWPVNCAVMLTGAAVWLMLAVLVVRRAALRQIVGPAIGAIGKRSSSPPSRTADSGVMASPAIRRVTGPPVIWKELRIPLFKAGPLKAIVVSILAAAIFIAAYGYCIYADCLTEKQVQMGFILFYLFLGLMRTVTVASSSLAGEKEAQTWALLLATPIRDSQIVIGKIVASVLRCWPFWALFGAHIIIFTFARCLHPITIVPMAILLVGSSLLVSAVGVFFSSCFKRTSVAAAVSLIAFIVFLLPVCCVIPSSYVGPFFVGGIVLDAVAGAEAARTPLYQLNYAFFGTGTGAFWAALFTLIGVTGIYLCAALVPYSIAEGNIRSKVF